MWKTKTGGKLMDWSDPQVRANAWARSIKEHAEDLKGKHSSRNYYPPFTRAQLGTLSALTGLIDVVKQSNPKDDTYESRRS